MLGGIKEGRSWGYSSGAEHSYLEVQKNLQLNNCQFPCKEGASLIVNMEAPVVQQPSHSDFKLHIHTFEAKNLMLFKNTDPW